MSSPSKSSSPFAGKSRRGGAAPLWRRLRATAAAWASEVSENWAALSLSQQFIVTAAVVLTAGMLFIGAWVANKIQVEIVRSSGATAALYTDSLIEPRVQELKRGNRLSPENQGALDDLLSPGHAGKTIVGFRIWKDNTVVYSSDKSEIGRWYPLNALRRQAWSGVVAARLDAWGYVADAHHAPLLEIYAPVRETGTQRIIALAETYEVAPALKEQVAAARARSWMVVGGTMFAIMALQFAIVHRGSRTISEQRNALRDRIGELSRLLRENETLRQRAHKANQRVMEINERYLRQLGADLHDGPVQFLGMALLRLDCLANVAALAWEKNPQEAEEDILTIREALTDSLEEIRNVSVGLAPPEVEKLSLAGALEMVARRHERRTGKPVAFEIGALPAEVPFPLKSCLYRFAQEGLNNAFRHANGEGQRIVASCDGKVLQVDVSDSGPGLGETGPLSDFGGQGLMSLRDRVQSLGGDFIIRALPGGGTCLSARFGIADGELLYG